MTPRFIPFEAMTDAEQREHLCRVHDYSGPYSLRVSSFGSEAIGYLHQIEHGINLKTGNARYLEYSRQGCATPHTHDKPTRSGTRNTKPDNPLTPKEQPL